MTNDEKLKVYHALMQAQQEHSFIFGFVFFALMILGMSIFPNHQVWVVVVALIVPTYLNYRFMTTHKCPFCNDNFFLLNRNKDFSEVKTIMNIPIQKVCVNCGEPTKNTMNFKD